MTKDNGNVSELINIQNNELTVYLESLKVFGFFLKEVINTIGIILKEVINTIGIIFKEVINTIGIILKEVINTIGIYMKQFITILLLIVDKMAETQVIFSVTFFWSLVGFCLYPNQFKSDISLALIPIKEAILTLWVALNDAIENIWKSMNPVVLFQIAFAITIMTAFPRILQQLADIVVENVTR
jgi:hypothetical protein